MITITLPSFTDRQAKGYAALIEGREASAAIAALVVAESESRGAALEHGEREAIAGLLAAMPIAVARELVTLARAMPAATSGQQAAVATMFKDAAAAVDLKRDSLDAEAERDAM